MKLIGDVSQEDRELAEQLELFEANVDADILPTERKAQIFTCLAHDWYALGSEEEGNRLLLKAEKTFPGYFKTAVTKHQAEDPLFDRVVKNITIELVQMLLGGLEEKKSESSN